MATKETTEKARLQAVIYCRVSSTKQKIDGGGLESQEQRCRAYAVERGYDVEAVFPDDASGGGDFMKRPGMVALLSYLDAQPDKNYIVVFDDLRGRPETRARGGWPGRGVIPDGCRSQSGQPHVDPGHPSAA